jgi:CheY-like chemotaxis protein/transcriptional regulator with XRE-family HTH domain
MLAEQRSVQGNIDMSIRAVALKEEGTHPPSEGVLARFANVRSIRSLKDLEKVKEERPDIVLMDVCMPRLDGKEAVEVLRQSRPAPVLVLFDATMQPTALLKQLNSLGTLKATRQGRPPSFSQIVRLLGVSQEVLSRILNVSARTAHRWLKGTRPRKTRELDRLVEVVSLLQQTLPNDEAIRSYLYHANPSLQGERPIDLLVRGEFDRVSADLQAVQEGVYV